MTEVFTTSAPALPCNWTVDTSCCEEWDTYSPSTQTAAAEYGAFTVWAATGRRVGLCTPTVRPCGREMFHLPAGYFWSEGTWLPYIFNGVWRNCAGCPGSALGCCTCEPTCQVWLPGPAYAIPATGVSVDGQIIPVDAWRIDNGQWLVRTDGNCWPACQNYDVDPPSVGSFQVIYQKGIPVPALLQHAAGELACEWARSCVGAACRLPQRVASVARQGVTISMVDIEILLKNGFTGISTVDQLIRNFNPYGLASRMGISSPDTPVIRTTTYG